MAKKATPNIAPYKPPAPPAVQQSVTAPAESAQKAVKDVRPGTNPMHAIRYLSGFVDGTVNHTLNGTAKWGRKGSYWGLGIGALLMISGAFPGFGLAILAVGWASGLVAGAVAGGAVGLATGGYRGVRLEQRKVEYKDELEAQAKGKTHQHREVDYRKDLHNYHDSHVKNNYFIDRVFQQDREIAQQTREESRGFFQDMVHHSRTFGSPEQGM